MCKELEFCLKQLIVLNSIVLWFTFKNSSIKISKKLVKIKTFKFVLQYRLTLNHVFYTL